MYLCCLMKSTATRGFVRSSCSSSSMGFIVSSGPIIPTHNRCKHTVRVILLDDLTGGQGYAGEVHTVKAGYARNFLIPTKKALYATPTNIQRVLGVVDPLGVDTAVQQQQQLQSISHASKDEDQHVKAADLLRYYLRNKILKIWRNVDTASTTTMASSSSSPSNNIMLHLTTYPGMVDAKAVQSKLSKQLKIDLDPNCDEEYIEISPTPVSHDLLDGTTTQGQDMMNQLLISMFPNHQQTQEKKKDDISSRITTTESQEDDNNNDISNQKKIQSQVQIRHLGEYLAKIHLKGNQYVGLRFSILKR